MSLNPILSYLEIWENNLAAAHHRYRGLYANSDSGEEDEAYHDLPESSSSSASFISRFSQSSLGRRLNFHYYPGAEVTHSDVPSLGETNGPDGQSNIGELERTSGSKTTAAFEVSRGKRIGMSPPVHAYAANSHSAGIIYGFAALKPVLVKEDVYECSTEDTVCYTQELRLNLMFAVASAAFSVSTLPIGAILTTYGPGVGNMTGSLFLAFGALLLSFGASLSFDAYIPGFLLLGVGGPFIFASALHLANAFPTHSTLILSALTGAFDSSNALFLVFRVANEKTGFSIRALFLVYLVVPLFILVMQLSVMPRTLYRTPEELVLQADVYAERHGPAGQQCNDGTDGRTTIQKTQTLINDTGDLSRNKPALSKSNQAPGPIPYINPHQLLPSLHESSLNSPRFVLLGLFTALQILRLNYFIASITRQSEFLSSAKARTLKSLFDILLPLGGITASLFTRPLLQRTTTQYILLALVTGATLTGAINCIPAVPAGYIHILAYVLYRPIFLTAIPESVGRMVSGIRCSRGIAYSVLISLSGLSNLVIPGLDALSFSVSRGDFLPVNAALTVASFVVGALLCGLPGKPEQGDTTKPAVEEGGLPSAMGEAADGSGWNERDVERVREQEPLLQRRVDTRESYGGIT